MSAGGYTPGPWTLNDRTPVIGIDTKDGGELLPIVVSVHGYDQKQAKANARLIAAAPDLLAGITRGRQKLATYVSVYPGDKELIGLLAEWDAAIAKATGSA